MATSAQLMNIVKRWKERKAEMQRTKLAAREKLPILTRAQVRAYRLPYHIATIQEVEENGNINSAEFLKQVIIFQEEYLQEHFYDALVQSRPKLIESKKALDMLATKIQIAEQNHFKDNIGGEVDEFMHLAVHFGFNTTDWLWLTEQIFSQAFKICNSYQNMEKKLALCSYLYGSYLLDQDLDIETCINFLNEARRLSAGHEWSAIKYLNKPQKTIFIESNKLLYKALCKLVLVVIKFDPAEAMKLCMLAKERALDACLGREEIYYLQGKCEMEIGKPKQAIESFHKSYLIYKAQHNGVKSCESRICLALAYLEVGEWERAYDELQRLRLFAEERELPNFVGLADLYVGQLYLNQGHPEKASPFLVKALHSFYELNDLPNLEFVSNLAAVSKGQEIMEQYVSLILKCEYDQDQAKKSNDILKLLSWKDIRSSFWEDMSELELVSPGGTYCLGEIDKYESMAENTEHSDEDFEIFESTLDKQD